jgi:Na+/melibiose symporter-like transporter
MEANVRCVKCLLYFFVCRENLIRVAFQCLQLVVTDFLPVMPWRCLPLCVDTAAKFGSQTQELNISLTAVGLMVCDDKYS